MISESQFVVASRCHIRRCDMQIEHNHKGRAFFHVDCINRFGGVMKQGRDDGYRTMFTCLHCGASGWYPRGGVGRVTCEKYVDHADGDAGNNDPQNLRLGDLP